MHHLTMLLESCCEFEMQDFIKQKGREEQQKKRKQDMRMFNDDEVVATEKWCTMHRDNKCN